MGPTISSCLARPSGLRSRRAQGSPLLFFNLWTGAARFPSHKWKRQRKNRRAPGTSAGEKAGCDERLRTEQTDFSPATGDSIACRSAGNQRGRPSIPAIAPLSLCAFARVVGWAALRYSSGRGILAPLASWRLKRVDGRALCPLCLCGCSFWARRACQTLRRTACMVNPSPSGLGRMRMPPASVGIEGTPAGKFFSSASILKPLGISATTPSFSSGSTEQVV